MKVILLEDVKGAGKKGQVIDASDGHARNYLIPRKKAIEATKAAVSELESKQKNAEHKHQKDMESAQATAKLLSECELTLTVRVGESGRMFGSVTGKELAEALQAKTGVAVDKKKIALSEPVRTVGRHTASVKLGAQVTAQINFDVVAG